MRRYPPVHCCCPQSGYSSREIGPRGAGSSAVFVITALVALEMAPIYNVIITVIFAVIVTRIMVLATLMGVAPDDIFVRARPCSINARETFYILYQWTPS